MNKKRLKVTIILHGAVVGDTWAYRRGVSQNITLSNYLFPDSDVVMLEDKYGHRYTRALPINPDNNFSYFLMI